jgi:putative ABC transport system ATP-binding protein
VEQLVELTAVVKVYPGAGQPAVDRVSLAIAEGEAVAIMGPSGSGKSSLLNLVAGLDRPTSGSIRVAGVELTRLGEAALARYRRSRVGLVFQFFNLLSNLTVLDNVAVPGELSGMSRRESCRRAGELLADLELGDRVRSFPAQLSGGQRQRVAVARALINRPALLLADEPTGALDTRSGEQVMDLLDELNRAGHTLVLVTHDPRLAARCASRVIRLVDGAVAEDSSALVTV